MAQLPAMRAMFSRLGLSTPAAHFMVHDQSIDSIAILTCLFDDQIENLCSICRKPGGMIAHPNAGDQDPAAANGDTTQMSKEIQVYLLQHYMLKT